jgi:hypothetical protein
VERLRGKSQQLLAWFLRRFSQSLREKLQGVPIKIIRSVQMDHQRHFGSLINRPEDVVKEHLILGTDERDAEEQIDLWLSQNPTFKVIKIHGVKREPENLLTLIGRKHVPRVSVMVEYEEYHLLAE